MYRGRSRGRSRISDTNRNNRIEGRNDMYMPVVPSLETEEDIAAWIADRKRKFPTQANIEAKVCLLFIKFLIYLYLILGKRA